MCIDRAIANQPSEDQKTAPVTESMNKVVVEAS